MNWNWYSLRRMRGALILILLGVVFFLQQSEWFHWDVWPLFLIGLGIILLAERLIPLPPPPPNAPYPTAPYPGSYPYQAQYPGQNTAQYPYGYPPTGQAPPANAPVVEAAPISDHPTNASGDWK